jgi:aspartate/methionine/tyrosine aminotransferase
MERQSVLLCPGDHFGLDGYVRFGLGEPGSFFSRALEEVAAGLRLIRDELA